MALALQYLLNALQLGSVYALIALGYTMVYGILTMINFAHGDIFMVGSYLAMWAALFLLGPSLHLPVSLVFLGALLFTMTFTAVLGVTIEYLAYRPLRQAPRVSAVITALGVGLFLENFTLATIGPEPRQVPAIIPVQHLSWAGASFTNIQILIIIVSIMFMLLLDWLVRHTLTGMAMRAISYNRPIVPLMGVPVNRIISMTFAIGSAIAGAGGLLYGLAYPVLDPVHGDPHRLVGLHCRGSRRHRQYPRGRAGRLSPGRGGNFHPRVFGLIHLPRLRGLFHAIDIINI